MGFFCRDCFLFHDFCAVFDITKHDCKCLVARTSHSPRSAWSTFSIQDAKYTRYAGWVSYPAKREDLNRRHRKIRSERSVKLIIEVFSSLQQAPTDLRNLNSSLSFIGRDWLFHWSFEIQSKILFDKRFARLHFLRLGCHFSCKRNLHHSWYVLHNLGCIVIPQTTYSIQQISYAGSFRSIYNPIDYHSSIRNWTWS